MKNKEVEQEKYKNAILYFLKYCNNQHLGATKLNKLLYYLDFISYRDREKSITGDRYIHKQYGPIPENVDFILKELQEEKYIEIKRVSCGKNKDFFRHKLLKNPDISVFDGYEEKLLENICDEFSLWSTNKIVDQTHLEAPWFYSKPFEEVDYSYSKDIDFFSEIAVSGNVGV